VTGGLANSAPRRAAVLARKYAYEADPAGYTQRGRTARADRNVTLRPAPDTMSLLTGFLPVEQGVACLAALRAHTDRLKNGGDERSRGQIMADVLVERVTGQACAGDVQAEVAIVLPVDALTDAAGAGAAEVVGHGPLPAPLALEILADSRGRRWWRRLFTAPHGGVIGGDPTRRCFDGTLATLIGYRDGARCREAFCDAPARQVDHIHPHRAGGPTTFGNGRATCARSNLAREMPGWDVRLAHDGSGEHPHTVATTTPTGHTYTSRAGPTP
jgi:HNH endonuclease